jgi:hypothetical protein
MSMPDDFRYAAALIAAQRILGPVPSPGLAATPREVSVCVYAILDAIYECERQRDDEFTGVVLCPKCLRPHGVCLN